MNTSSGLLESKKLKSLWFVVVMGWVCSSSAWLKGAEAESKSETESESVNSVRLIGTAITIDGNKAEFLQRHGMSKDLSAGVEEFFFKDDLTKTSVFQMEGHGIFDAHDYELKLQVNKEDTGYIKTGYREFRTWYNGEGGFFPQNGRWFSLYDNDLSVDRGSAWFEVGLTLPDVPQFILRYEYEFRNGQKDSTLWGDTGLTSGFGTRKIVPSFRDLDEHRHILTGDAKHTIGQTDLNLGLRYEITDNNDSLNIIRNPFEASGRYLTQRDFLYVDMSNVHAATETRFSEKVTLTTGYSYTTLDSDISGNRIYGIGFNSPYLATFTGRQQRDEGFLDLLGGSKMKQYVMNINLMTIPLDDLTLIVGLRAEKVDEESVSEFLDTDVGAGAAAPSTQTLENGSNDNSALNVSQIIEARYTGVTNWVFYARGEWEEGTGDQMENVIIPDTSTLVFHRDTDNNRFGQKYTAGFNWYPYAKLNMGGKVYHKINSDSYTHRNDSTFNTAANAYPAFINYQDFYSDGVNFRITWRPCNGVTSISRYDFQISTTDMNGGALNEIESMESKRHSFGESLTWSPTARLYFQGNINYVLNQTDTPANSSLSGGAYNLILLSENNYMNASFVTGYALNPKTDLRAEYTYYIADNYRDNSISSLPYGAGDEEHGITMEVIRHITQNFQWTLKYGYFRNREETYGGMDNYDAHLICTTLSASF